MTNKGFFMALLWPLVALITFASLLWVERAGVPTSMQQSNAGFLPAAVLNNAKKQQETECLLVYDGQADAMLHSNIAYVLDSMCVRYHSNDARTEQSYDLGNYRTVILALTNLDLLRSSIMPMLDWVKAGGQLLLAYSPEPSITLNAVSGKLGLINTDFDYGVQNRARLTTNLLPGGMGQEYDWSAGDRYGLVVQLSDACRVHMVSVNDDMDEVPMLWEYPLGQGRVVFNNNDAFAYRESRGLVAAAYSLLDKVFAYPVINASMYFIDDFPAPIPEGRNEYIDRFYNVDVESFYTNIWFPTIMGFARKYGLRYTGFLIETYNDRMVPPFPKVTQVERFRYFGNILLEDGHEIGLHGYNHMPLVPSSFDYMGLYNAYKKWGSADDMAASIQEILRFSEQAIPGSQLKTYVPPANVLSVEGRLMLHEHFPQINTISSVYFQEDLAYGQEFDVGGDGIVNLPRIIAGCLLSDYNRWTALSELNFHYVNSHFLHPDDALDRDRGAGFGWEKLSANLDQYLQWLYGSAKGIRNLTAQQGAMAVQRYCNLSVERKLTMDSYVLDIGGFYDEAWLLVRLNGCSPANVKGGSLQQVSGSLYLLRATSAHVEIKLRDGDGDVQ